MSDGKRPGGLTALAVLNFVFGGLGILAVLALFALMNVADRATEGEATRQVFSEAPGLLWVQILLGLATTALMIVSGVGYLGQKRFLGRTMGNLYAVLSLVGTAIGIVATKTGFNLSTMIGIVYPILTLFLLNTTFKDDLVR